MLTTCILAAAIVWVAGLALTVRSARVAPVGYEDAHGFHVVETSDPLAGDRVRQPIAA